MVIVAASEVFDLIASNILVKTEIYVAFNRNVVAEMLLHGYNVILGNDLYTTIANGESLKEAHIIHSDSMPSLVNTASDMFCSEGVYYENALT